MNEREKIYSSFFLCENLKKIKTYVELKIFFVSMKFFQQKKLFFYSLASTLGARKKERWPRGSMTYSTLQGFSEDK